MQGSVGIVWAAVGLGIGCGLAYLIRRWRGARAQRRRDATPIVYASRQEARKAARQREKATRSGARQ